MGNTLRHHGILGMKWGVRRFQNRDGTLTPAKKNMALKEDMNWVKKNSFSASSRAMKGHEAAFSPTNMHPSKKEILNCMNQALEEGGYTKSPNGLKKFVAVYNDTIRRGNPFGVIVVDNIEKKEPSKSNTLRHHGILGMKWGVRRTPDQLGRNNKNSSSDEAHDDYKKARATKQVKSMSDAELRERINRLQMEKQYSQLTSVNTTAGIKFVKSILMESAKQTASKYVSQYLSKGVETLIKMAAK